MSVWCRSRSGRRRKNGAPIPKRKIALVLPAGRCARNQQQTSATACNMWLASQLCARQVISNLFECLHSLKNNTEMSSFYFSMKIQPIAFRPDWKATGWSRWQWPLASEPLIFRTTGCNWKLEECQVDRNTRCQQPRISQKRKRKKMCSRIQRPLLPMMTMWIAAIKCQLPGARPALLPAVWSPSISASPARQIFPFFRRLDPLHTWLHLPVHPSYFNSTKSLHLHT